MYSSNAHKHTIKELDVQVPVHSLKNYGMDSTPKMWVTAHKIDKKVKRGGGTLYQIWIGGVALPERDTIRINVRVAGETTKSKAFTVAAFLLSLDRPILLDMIRNAASEWYRMKLGVQSPTSGRTGFRQSDGVPFIIEA